MLSRRLALASLFALALGTGSGFAGETKAYSDAAFGAAQAAGKPILVDVTASWCPTCKAQRPIIGALAAKPEFKDLVILEVDFDTQTDALKKFGVRNQSTLITFRGKTETSRTVGSTNPDAIAQQLATVLGG